MAEVVNVCGNCAVGSGRDTPPEARISSKRARVGTTFNNEYLALTDALIVIRQEANKLTIGIVIETATAAKTRP